jgi:histidyl-tRNA synthetase
VLVPLGEAGERAATKLLADLRGKGVAADMAFRGNMKKRMAKADTAGARFAIIIGDSEVEAGAAQLKDLATGEQQAVSFDALAEALRK